MKDLKLITAIISAVALGACTGGSSDLGSVGGHPSAPVTGQITVPTNTYTGLNTNPSVNDDNTSLTGMASYTVSNATEVNEAMYNYVAGLLPSVVDGSRSSTRGASLRAGLRDGEPPVTQAQIDAAIAKINQMKGVLLDLTSDNVDLDAYITNNRQLVAESLCLFFNDGEMDVNTITVQELLDMLTAHHDDLANIETAFADFDNAHDFEFSVEDLNKVDFKLVGGDDMILHFQVDDNGKIIKAGPGSIENGEFVVSDEYGWLNRGTGSNDNNFTAVWEKYTIDLSAILAGMTYPEGHDHAGEHLLLADFINNGGGGIVGPKFTRPSEVSIAEIRAELIAQFNAEVDKFINSQPTDTPDATLAQYRADAALLLAATLDNDEWWNAHNSLNGEGGIAHTTDNIAITFTGIGKDVISANGKKLQYSDFGYVTMNENGHITDYQPYTGGYASRKVIEAPANTLKYTGTAIAGLTATGAAPRLLRQDNAELVHSAETGLSTLTMDNLEYQDDNNVSHDWYTMVVTMHDTNGTTDELSFHLTQLIDESLGNVEGNLKDIEEAYQLQHSDTVLDRTFVHDGTLASGDGVTVHQDGSQYVWNAETGDTSYRGSAEVNYYGADGVESEATVGFHFTEDYHPQEGEGREISVYGAFGGVDPTIVE